MWHLDQGLIHLFLFLNGMFNFQLSCNLQNYLKLPIGKVNVSNLK